jgi:hypothetical protein
MTDRLDVVGRMLPDVVLSGWPSRHVDVRRDWRASSVLLSTHPGVVLEPGGMARRDSRVLAWAARAKELRTLGYDVALVSTEATETVRALVEALDAPVTLLCDARLTLAANLPLPTVAGRAGRSAYDDVTLLAHESEVKEVFFGTGNADADVAAVLSFLREIHG